MSATKSILQDPQFELFLRLQELRRRNARGPVDIGLPTKAAPALAGVATEQLVADVRELEKSIYGVDDRKDLYEVTDAAVLRDADSTVSLFRASDISENADGTTTLPSLTLGDRRNLCPGERFHHQPSGAFCSGVLVGRDLIATAGHCVDAGTVTSTRFVFGYRLRSASDPATRVSSAEVYRSARLVGRVLTSGGSDWALVRLDRQVPNHKVARIRGTGRIGNGTAVHIIGHPSGIPAKYAPGATIQDNTPTTFFRANLDAFGGNSGSPVFNSATHEVEGLLVRGATDYVASGSCNIALVVPTTGTGGEDVTRATEFSALITAPPSTLLLRRGDQGPAVQQWQSQIVQAHDETLQTDGIFGPLTEAATIAFQRDHGLSADGVVGPQTRAAMQAALPAVKQVLAGGSALAGATSRH